MPGKLSGDCRAAPRLRGPTLITGGAGFIGTNVAHRIAGSGWPVIVFDNLSRAGVQQNLAFLQRAHGALVEFIPGDVTNARQVRSAVGRAAHVFHFAAQVAVTTSLENPRHDFRTNVGGTLNVLEAMRRLRHPPTLLFTSTNKVYGDLEGVALQRRESRYEPRDAVLRRQGVGEWAPLSFHSPYGCSKGAADQYVLDYARCYGLPAVVFRMSCIYGRHQMGTEDQGWVAHFLLRVLQDEPLTIYGDGLQVRDILFADDLVDAMLLATHQAQRLRGTAFNMGGGPARATSLVELMDLIREIHGRAPRVRRAAWRTGDQRYYVSDTSRFSQATGWLPRTGVRDGVALLYDWLASNPAAEIDITPRTPRFFQSFERVA